MKTKFILHGGFTPGKKDEDNSKYYAEILRDTSEKVRILLVPFAKDDERIPDAEKKVMADFILEAGKKELIFESANKKSFLEQIESADVIYLHGGSTVKLLETLKEYSNLQRLFIGKTVAGESAGANVLATTFYSPNSNKIGKGLGFLPIKIIPHYSEQYKGKLENLGKDLAEVFLPEYQFKVYFQSS